MAAASVAGLEAHNMDERKFQYFSSINSMAKKIMQEREKIKHKHGSTWEKMSPQEQDNAIDNWMMDPHIRARYAMHRVDREEVVCYPKLLIQTGQKIVHFGEEDITWQDEHSAPFSWETKSQLEFSLTPSSDHGVSISQGDPKPAKTPHSNQFGKKEESAFWKISAERSRLEGEQADFQSLTPSQIKSLEKGEKPLPSYLRQVSHLSQLEPHPVVASRPAKQRAPKPPAPQPPIAKSPAASISISPNPVPPLSVSSSVAGWERSQSTLPVVSYTVDEVFPNPSPLAKSPTVPSNKEKEEDASPASPAFSQLNSSNSILKTGFDFLDNW
nr:uncharacterized protein C1orf198 homolog [Nerophis lumbriciformis]